MPLALSRLYVLRSNQIRRKQMNIENASALQYLSNASYPVQGVVLILASMSIASWSLILWKRRQFADESASIKRLGQASKQMGEVEHAIRDQLVEEQRTYEAGLDWLASIATTAPYVGLFGTVMGVLHAFTGLATLADTSLQAVAPGISEALVVTAIGLVTAVPAAVGYTRFQHQARAKLAQLEAVAIRMLDAGKAGHAR
jgi:biopolymer transport protein ExbB/TolQ